MRSEEGQLLPVVAVILVVAVLAAVGLGRLGLKAVQYARAAAAADAAALDAAAVPSGGSAGAARSAAVTAAAKATAEANGADIVSVLDDGATVAVVVRLGAAQASARAARAGDQVDAGLRAAIARAGDLLGRPVPVARFVAGGLAFTVGDRDITAFAAAAGGAGLCPASADTGERTYEVCDPPPLGTNSDTTQQPVRSVVGSTTPVGASPESKPTEE